MKEWKHIILDQKGDIIKDKRKALVTNLGTRIALEDNYLIIYENNNFIMEIFNGHIFYKDLWIYSVQGPNDGIYGVIWTINTESGKTTTQDNIEGIVFAGYKSITVLCDSDSLRHLKVMIMTAQSNKQIIIPSVMLGNSVLQSLHGLEMLLFNNRIETFNH